MGCAAQVLDHLLQRPVMIRLVHYVVDPSAEQPVFTSRTTETKLEDGLYGRCTEGANAGRMGVIRKQTWYPDYKYVRLEFDDGLESSLILGTKIEVQAPAPAAPEDPPLLAPSGKGGGKGGPPAGGPVMSDEARELIQIGLDDTKAAAEREAGVLKNEGNAFYRDSKYEDAIQ